MKKHHPLDGLGDEIRDHIERETAENIERGMSPEEARLAAKRAFGSTALVQDQARDVWIFRWLQDLARDRRFGVRALRKNPFLTLSIACILGCAIAASVIVFSVVNALVLRPLPFANPDTLQFIWSADTRRPETRILTSYGDYLDWRSRARSFEDLAALRFARMNLAATGTPLRVATIAATPNLLPLLGVEPEIGRTFTSEDGAPDATPVALLSHGFWMRSFGGDPAVIGSTVRLNAVAHTVVGIISPSVERGGPLQADVWTVLSDTAPSADRADRSYLVIGRLAAGFSRVQATAELTAVARSLEAEHPDTNQGWSVRVLSPRDLSAGSRLILTILGLVVGLLLLIACGNVAGLLTARAVARSADTAVRLALGASRRRLVQQWLVESLLLSILATAVGIALARTGVRVLAAWLGDVDPFVAQMRIDRAAVAFATVLACFVPMLFGIAPAVAALRNGTSDQLRPSGARGMIGAGARLRRVLVVSQFAMTMALLVVAGLSVRTAVAIRDIPLGFDPDNTLAMRLELSGNQYESMEAPARFVAGVVSALMELPGVTSVAASNRIPIVDREAVQRFAIEGRTERSGGDWAGRVVITPDFPELLRIPLLHGRSLQEGDGPNSPRVALINQTLAKQYWPTGDPVGAQVRFTSTAGSSPAMEIVGIIGDVRNSDADQPPVPQIYVPLAQNPERALAFYVRTRSGPAAFIDAIRQRVAAIDADQALFDIRTLRRFVFDDLAGTMLAAGLLATFGIIAFALAIFGLYGMLAWTVVSRTSEIGLRMALGARASAIMMQLLHEGVRLAGLGILVGLLVGAGLAQAIRGTLYGVSPVDPAIFVGLPIVLVGAALLAVYGPARHATKVDPVVALRCE